MYSTVLLIVLCKRMVEENTDNIKIVSTPVEFPLENFCSSSISNVQEQSSVDLSYNLIGTVDYKARRNGGHYTANTKKANNWHCYNNNEVTTIQFQCRKENRPLRIFQRSAVMLLYCQSPEPEP